jgi:hypothetical protein
MGLIIWGGVLPACLFVGWLILRRPVRQFAEELHVDHARDLFRQQREWLEARFLSALAKVDPIERIRWEDAHWHDEVLWARDRQTRVFLALIGVHFDTSPFDELGEPRPRNPTAGFHEASEPRQATALFEYRKGRWLAEGKRLDEIRPDEVVLRNHRFEPVVLQPRRGY